MEMVLLNRKEYHEAEQYQRIYLCKLDDFQFKMRSSKCHLLEDKDNAKILGTNTSQSLAPKTTEQLHCVAPCTHHSKY